MDVLQVAQQRIAQLESELERLRVFVDTYRQLASAAVPAPGYRTLADFARTTHTSAGPSPPKTDATDPYEQGLARLAQSGRPVVSPAGRGGAKALIDAARARVSKTAMIEAKITEILARHRPAPMLVNTIFEHLNAAGVEVGGEEPMRNLSVYLSRSPKFVKGPLGWSLVEDTKEEAPPNGNPDGAS